MKISFVLATWSRVKSSEVLEVEMRSSLAAVPSAAIYANNCMEILIDIEYIILAEKSLFCYRIITINNADKVNNKPNTKYISSRKLSVDKL